MAAIAKLRAKKQPPYYIKSSILYEDYPTTAVYNSVQVPTTGTRTTSVNRKQVLPFAPDSSNIERLVRCFHDFKQASNKDLLDLEDEKLHTKAREIIGGELKSTWDDVVAKALAINTQANPTISTADFTKNVRQFLRAYMPSNAFNIQRDYMVLAAKPFNMSCYELASRLRLLNTLSVYLPGSGGTQLFPDDTAMKNAIYRLMLPQWQLNFDASGNELDDNNYSITRLVAYMEQQRLHYDAQEELKQRQQVHKRPPYRQTQAMSRYNNYQPYPRNYQNSPRNTPPRLNRFNTTPMRSFREKQNTKPVFKTPAPRPNQRPITSSQRPQTRSVTQKQSQPNRRLNFYQGNTYCPRHDNYYAQEDNYYHDEDQSNENHDQQNEDGFFNQELHEQHDDGFFNQDIPDQPDNFDFADDTFHADVDDFPEHDPSDQYAVP